MMVARMQVRSSSTLSSVKPFSTCRYHYRSRSHACSIFLPASIALSTALSEASSASDANHIVWRLLRPSSQFPCRYEMPRLICNLDFFCDQGPQIQGLCMTSRILWPIPILSGPFSLSSPRAPYNRRNSYRHQVGNPSGCYLQRAVDLFRASWPHSGLIQHHIHYGR